MVKPYEWQEEDQRVLAEAGYVALAAIETGGGKSALGAFAIENSGAEVTLIIAPQSTHDTAWRDWVRDVTGITPRVIGNGLVNHKRAMADFEWQVPGVYLVTPQLFTRSDVSEWAGDLLIVDECFSPGTLISTPNGDQAIETLREGDEVWGYDHEREEVVLTTVRARSETVQKLLPEGVTANHPFYVVGLGYIPYGDLTKEDNGYVIDSRTQTVRTVPHRVHTPEISEDAEILLQVMCGEVQGKDSAPSPDPGSAKGGSGVSVLRKSVSGNRYEHTPKLQQRMCKQEYGGSSESSSKGDKVPKLLRRVFTFPVQASKILFNSVFPSSLVKHPGGNGSPCEEEQSNDPEKPHAGPRSAEAGKGGEDLARGGSARRERQREPYRKTFLGKFADRMGVGSHRSHRQESPGDGITEPLQDRLCYSDLKTGSGSRWREPQLSEETGAGQEEKPLSDPYRVDSLKILQPRSPGRYLSVRNSGRGREGTAYNLETGTGNYFAGGMLVHNCHMLANAGKSGQRKLSGYDAKDDPINQRFPMRIALSGTPFRNKFENAWGVMRFLWPEKSRSGEIAYDNHYMWKYQRMTSKEIVTERTVLPNGEVKLKKATDWIGEREPGRLITEAPTVIQHFRRRRCCEWHPNGFLPTEEPLVTYREVPLTATQKRAMAEVEKHNLTWLEEHPLVVQFPMTKLQRMRQLVLGEPTVTWTENEDGEQEMHVDFDLNCKSPAIDSLIELIESLDVGEPVAVYMESQKFARVTTHRLNQAGITAFEYSGKVSKKERQANLDSFGKEGGHQVVVGVISSIGTGTDGIQRVCNTDVFLETSLDNTNQHQVESRTDRLGAKGQVQRFYIVDDLGYSQGRMGKQVEKVLAMRASITKGK